MITYLSYLHYKDSNLLSNMQVFNKKSLSYLQIYFVMYQSLTVLKKAAYPHGRAATTVKYDN